MAKRQIAVLSLMSAFALGLLLFTFTRTAPYIARAERLAAAYLLTEALGNTPYDNNLLETSLVLTAAEAGQLGLAEGARLYVATRDGTPQGMLIPVVHHAGYGGPIELIVGLSMGGEITGVRALRHRETPGLGGKIDLVSGSGWILGFKGKSLELPASAWRVKSAGGEFDQIAGATITSSAVIQSVYRAQRFFADHKNQLLGRFHGPDTTTQSQATAQPTPPL